VRRAAVRDCRHKRYSTPAPTPYPRGRRVPSARYIRDFRPVEVSISAWRQQPNPRHAWPGERSESGTGRPIQQPEARLAAVVVEVSAEIQGTGQLLPHRPRGAECLAAGIFSALPGRQQQPSQTRMVERLRGADAAGLMLSFVEVLALVRTTGSRGWFAWLARTIGTHPAARTVTIRDLQKPASRVRLPALIAGHNRRGRAHRQGGGGAISGAPKAGHRRPRQTFMPAK